MKRLPRYVNRKVLARMFPLACPMGRRWLDANFSNRNVKTATALRRFMASVGYCTSLPTHSLPFNYSGTGCWLLEKLGILNPCLHYPESFVKMELEKLLKRLATRK